MPVSIQIGGTSGGPDRKAGTAPTGPSVVININASARAEPAPSQAASAAAPLSAGAAPTLPGAQGSSPHAPAGEAATTTAPGLVLSAGPAPSLADFKAAAAVPHGVDSHTPAGAASAGGAPLAGADPD